MVLGSSLNFPDDIVFFFSHPYLFSFIFKTYVFRAREEIKRNNVCVCVCVCVCVHVLGGWLSLKLICLVDNKNCPSLPQNTSPEGWGEQSHPQRRVGRVGAHVQPLIPVAPARAHKPSYHPLALGDQGRRCLESSRQGWVKYSSLLFVLVAFLCPFLGYPA